MWLLIDDQRNLNVDVIARNSSSARELLELGSWACVIFDNDLGEVIEGHHIMRWAIENNLLPKRVQLVTSNPAARDRMRDMLEVEGYTSIDGLDFKK